MDNQFGPYEIIEKIGVGGIGTIYRARNAATGQVVALKVTRPEFSEDVAFIRCFRREATIAGSLASPNIVAFLEVGQDGDTPYSAMELIEGESPAVALAPSDSFSLEKARYQPSRVDWMRSRPASSLECPNDGQAIVLRSKEEQLTV